MIIILDIAHSVGFYFQKHLFRKLVCFRLHIYRLGPIRKRQS